MYGIFGEHHREDKNTNRTLLQRNIAIPIIAIRVQALIRHQKVVFIGALVVEVVFGHNDNWVDFVRRYF